MEPAEPIEHIVTHEHPQPDGVLGEFFEYDAQRGGEPVVQEALPRYLEMLLHRLESS